MDGLRSERLRELLLKRGERVSGQRRAGREQKVMTPEDRIRQASPFRGRLEARDAGRQKDTDVKL
jgi:hypothetical protein